MSDPNHFRLILFDIGNVILPFNLRKATAQFEKISRLPSEEIIRAVMGTSLDWSFEKGEISPEAFYEEVKRRTGLTLPYDRFVPIWSDIFSENRVVSNMVRKLKKKYTLALLSNTNILHFNHVHEHFSIIRDVEYAILSFREGLRKPDPKIFQIAFNRFHVTPKQTLYVDDRENFVIAGQKLGLEGIHFKSEEALAGELASRGILPA